MNADLQDINKDLCLSFLRKSASSKKFYPTAVFPALRWMTSSTYLIPFPP